jgi:TonB family protein
MIRRFDFLAWILGPVLAFPAAALAEWRCDCMTVVDSCQAQVVVQQDRIEITADRPQCARVDYFIDGMPFVAVLVDGQYKENWLARSSDPRVVVQSCQVCLDRAEAAPATASSAAEGPVSELEPLIQVAPEYPPAAQASGLDGRVEVTFSVDGDGNVSDASVVSAEPSGLFDAAALEAVSRWRYPAAAGRAPQRVSRQIEFRFAEYVWQLPLRPRSESAAVAPEAPANQCLRQSVSYNFGDTIEVGMINACPDPVMVFGCAEGVGGNVGRWACVDSDAARALVAAQNDPRLGSQSVLPTAAGAQSFEFADEFFILRAPNSPIWWAACQWTDQSCLDRARQWVRALDGQVASVDPRARTDLALAQAY